MSGFTLANTISAVCAAYLIAHSVRSAFFMSIRTCDTIRVIALGFCVGGFAVMLVPFNPHEEWLAGFGYAVIMLSIVGLMRFGRRPGIDRIKTSRITERRSAMGDHDAAHHKTRMTVKKRPTKINPSHESNLHTTRGKSCQDS